MNSSATNYVANPFEQLLDLSNNIPITPMLTPNNHLLSLDQIKVATGGILTIEQTGEREREMLTIVDIFN